MPNKHHAQRAAILQQTGTIPNGNTPRRTRGTIKPTDYAAVPPPLNLKVQPAGDCLIWLGKLNTDGYGISQFPQGERLAHRQTFKHTRLTPPESNILHMCNRPYCIQPSHLYEGSKLDNSNDHRMRITNGIDFALSQQKAQTAQQIAKYRWPSPPRSQDPLWPPNKKEVSHDCEFIIPAGDERICAACGTPPDQALQEQDTHQNLQPPDNNRSTYSVVQRKRTFTTLNDGMVIRVDSQPTITHAKTRAERRRREKKSKKLRFDRPVLLHQAPVDLTKPASITIECPTPIPGPGLIALVLRTRTVK